MRRVEKYYDYMVFTRVIRISLVPALNKRDSIPRTNKGSDFYLSTRSGRKKGGLKEIDGSVIRSKVRRSTLPSAGWPCRETSGLENGTKQISVAHKNLNDQYELILFIVAFRRSLSDEQRNWLNRKLKFKFKVGGS
jgi:hypothetical protein